MACWGQNLNGELGDGSTTERLAPVPVVGVGDAVQLSAGKNHACVVHMDGQASCWGSNGSGQLGQGGTSLTVSYSPTALAVVGVTDAVEIAAGGAHTCVVRGGGRLSCWGSDLEGQVGDGDPPPPTILSGPVQTSPSDVFASGVTHVALGNAHSCAVLGGAIRCWGENGEGEVGDGTYTNHTSPVALEEFVP